MTVIRKTWYKMSAKALHKHLTDTLKWPLDLAANISKQVWEEKQAARKAKVKEGHVYNAWQVLLASARAELSSVRVLKSQIKSVGVENPKKWTALCEYENCITSTIEKLKKVQDAGEHTPMQFAEFLRTTVGRPIPNDGTFWVDYIKPADRRRIETLFDGLPPPMRGKKKVPFERRIPTALHRVQRDALFKQLEKAEAGVHMELDMQPDSFITGELEDKLQKIYRAKYVLDQKPRNAPLPTKWQSLLD